MARPFGLKKSNILQRETLIPTIKPRVKICCIQSVEEAWLAIRYGASALGLVSEMPSGPGIISGELIRTISSIIPPGISSFLLTSKIDVHDIIAQQKEYNVNVIQICDRLSAGNYRALKKAMPGVSIVQVVHVRGEESFEESLSLDGQVDALLLDSGNPAARIKKLGGTGRTHDWNLSKRIREAVNTPVFLAGGLRAENVAQAIATVAPFGIDVCSGVREKGSLSERKLAEFMKNAGIVSYLKKL